MILVISGLHGTGKSTIAKQIAKEFNLEHHSTGDLFRELAKQKEMSLQDFSEYAINHPEVDLELDEMVKKIAESGRNVIFDGQMSTYILGDLADYCILLKCAKDVRLERMQARDNVTKEYIIEETIKRESIERQRFIDLYAIDILDGNLILANFDLILDVTHIGVEPVSDIVIKAIKSALNK